VQHNGRIFVPVKQTGFSLTEVLIAMAISSVLLLSAVRFLPGLQRSLQTETRQQEIEEEIWLRLSGIGKHLQRAGFCAGNCMGEALHISTRGECVIAQWDENSNGRWETSPLAAAEQTGFRLNAGALETLRGATSCGGKGWERITDPDRVTVVHFRVEKTLRPGFAPELTLALSAAFAGREGRVFQAHHAVTGYNL
jgi:prepilin peptidase dependent protein B